MTLLMTYKVQRSNRMQIIAPLNGASSGYEQILSCGDITDLSVFPPVPVYLEQAVTIKTTTSLVEAPLAYTNYLGQL